MKKKTNIKIISILCSITILITSISFVLPTFAATGNSIDTVVEELSELYQEEAENGKELEESAECRVIVKANRKPDTYGDAQFVKGTDKIYIYQYQDVTSANAALDYYNSLSYVQWVEKDEKFESQSISYGTDMLGTDEAKEYLKQNNIKFENTINVAVIDDGLLAAYFNKYDRVIDSHFNSSGSEESDTAATTGTHGTFVTNTIVDNTTDNVNIIVYKAADYRSIGTALSYSMAIDKAVEDSVNVINLSISGAKGRKSDLLQESINKALEKNIAVVVAAGNRNDDAKDYFPANVDGVFTVGAVDWNGNRTYFSNYGECVDFVAPGYQVEVYAYENYSYHEDGTSFSAPYIVSACAEALSVNPELTISELKDRLIDSCIKPSDMSYFSPYIKGLDIDIMTFIYKSYENDAKDESLYYGYGMPQIQKIIGENIKSKSPKFSVSSGIYNNKFEVSIMADEDSTIYYTTDGKYPTTKNGIVYKSPITISETTSIRAIAYSNNKGKSNPSYAEYKMEYLVDESDFTIDERGYITSYSGKKREIKIPDTINGKTVLGVAKTAFYDDFDENYYISRGEPYSLDGHLLGVSLPDSVKDIETQAFQNTTLKYFTANGLKQVGDSALAAPLVFMQAPNIEYIDNYGIATTDLAKIELLNLKLIGEGAFQFSNFLYEVNFPLLDNIPDGAFDTCRRLTHVNIPNAKSINDYWSFDECNWLRDINIESVTEITGIETFQECHSLKKIELPNLQKLNSKNCFANSAVNYIYAPKLETATSLPTVKNSTIILSSLFKNCTENTKGRNYKVYGITGSDAETWAKGNNHTFIGIPAIITDIPDVYDGTNLLSVEAVGIDLCYKWYGSDNENGTDSVLLNTETDGRFNPLEYRYYPYYFCICEMKDDGKEFSVQSAICKNADYRLADYSKVDELISKTPADLSLYTDESVAQLNNVLNSIEKDLPVTEQDVVNDYAAQLEQAVNNLEYKKADLDKLNQAIKSVPADLSIYTDDSVKALEDLIEKSKDYEHADITKQEEINTLAQQIYDAVDGLEEKKIPTETKPTQPDKPSEKPTKPSESTTEKSSVSESNTQNAPKKNTDMKSPLTGNDNAYIVISISVLVSLSVLFVITSQRKKKSF